MELKQALSECDLLPTTQVWKHTGGTRAHIVPVSFSSTPAARSLATRRQLAPSRSLCWEGILNEGAFGIAEALGGFGALRLCVEIRLDESCLIACLLDCARQVSRRPS